MKKIKSKEEMTIEILKNKKNYFKVLEDEDTKEVRNDNTVIASIAQGITIEDLKMKYDQMKKSREIKQK